VNWQADELSRRVLDVLMLTPLDGGVTWVSPLEKDDFAEYRDQDFLQALGLQQLVDGLRSFWPANGPCWDALAVVRTGGNQAAPGVLLVEAKAHVSELCGEGCGAGQGSYRTIDIALRKTQSWLGVSHSLLWTGRFYQYANRLAHLYFLLQAGVPAWLVNVHFLADWHFRDYFATVEQCRAAIAQVKAELGLTAALIPHVADLFLQVWEPPACGGVAAGLPPPILIT
jgi:hypothetical protein